MNACRFGYFPLDPWIKYTHLRTRGLVTAPIVRTAIVREAPLLHGRSPRQYPVTELQGERAAQQRQDYEGPAATYWESAPSAYPDRIAFLHDAREHGQSIRIMRRVLLVLVGNEHVYDLPIPRNPDIVGQLPSLRCIVTRALSREAVPASIGEERTHLANSGGGAANTSQKKTGYSCILYPVMISVIDPCAN